MEITDSTAVVARVTSFDNRTGHGTLERLDKPAIGDVGAMVFNYATCFADTCFEIGTEVVAEPNNETPDLWNIVAIVDLEG